MGPYVLAGLLGIGGGLSLSRGVEWMGARRGLSSYEAGPWKAVPRILSVTVLCAVLVSSVATGRGALEILRRSTLALLLLGSADADGRWGLIPNELILAGLVGAIVVVAGTNDWGEVLAAGLGASGGLYLVRYAGLWVLGQPGFGIGDIKLMGVLGLFLGWQAFWVFYLAALGAGLIGGMGLLLGVLSRGSRLPFAPFLALGTMANWFLLPFDAVFRWLSL